MRSRSPQLLVFLMGALLVFLAGSAPIGAIETEAYGLDVVDQTEDGRLHLQLQAGETTTGRVKVWNKTDAPLTLQLSVAPAQVAEDGTVSLGGDADVVDWVDLEAEQVQLAAGQERVVEVGVDAPRKLDGETRAVAIQVEPAATAGGEQPAVIQRLALTTYLEPDQDSLIASLGLYPWIALAVLLAVVIAVVASRRRPGADQ